MYICVFLSYWNLSKISLPIACNITADLKALCHAVRADCLLMMQLSRVHSCDKFKFANAHHRLFKCIQCCIFESGIYVGVDVLVVSLQSVPYCLRTLPFVLLLCWMRNSIASASEYIMIQLALSFTSFPRITSTLELLPMVILILLLSAVKGGPPNLNSRLSENSSENLSTTCSNTAYSHSLHCYTMRAITSYTHFDYIFVITSVIKKHYRDSMPLSQSNPRF